MKWGAGRPLKVFLAGLLVSRLGDQITQLALPWVIYDLTGSASVMGAAAAAFSAPMLLNPLIGALVDRADQRRLLIGADLFRAALIVVIPLLWMLRALGALEICVLAFALGTATLAYELAVFAISPSLVTAGDAPLLNGIFEGIGSFAGLVGPALAGALVGALGAPLALLLDGASFLATAAPLAWLFERPARPPAERGAGAGLRSLGRDAWVGVRFVLHHPVLRSLGLCFLVKNFATSASFGVLVYHFRRELGLGVAQIGLIYSAAGATATLSALATAWYGPRTRWSVVVLISAAAQAAAIAGFATARSTFGLVGAALVWGAASSAINPLTRTLRQRIVPPELLARVQAASGLLAHAATPLGALVGGLAAEAYGAGPVLHAGSALLLGSGLIVLLTPLRRV